jgi:hypothetical protein
VVEFKSDKDRVDAMCTRLASTHGVSYVRDIYDADKLFQQSDRPLVRAWLLRRELRMIAPRLFTGALAVVGAAAAVVSCIKT